MLLTKKYYNIKYDGARVAAIVTGQGRVFGTHRRYASREELWQALLCPIPNVI